MIGDKGGGGGKVSPGMIFAVKSLTSFQTSFLRNNI